MVTTLETLGAASLALFDVLTFFAAGSCANDGEDIVPEGAIL